MEKELIITESKIQAQSDNFKHQFRFSFAKEITMSKSLLGSLTPVR